MEKYIKDTLLDLENYVRVNDYSGYDPYDALNSELLNSIKSKWLRVLFTQFFVYNPINLRLFFNIKKEENPKAIGLFLSAYCKLYKSKFIEREFFENIVSKLVGLLLKNNSKNFSEYCWGFNFNWQDVSRDAKRYLPTIVVTSYVGNSFLDLYEITKEEKYRDISKSICRFITNDLNITEKNNGICFSYTPIDKYIVHNANCLGAAYLTRVYSITKDKKLLDYSQKALNFSISHQNKDGSWTYSINPKTNKVRNQIDFHQGFILDSIIDFIKYSNIKDNIYCKSLVNGSIFYINQQFDKLGRSRWRLPWSYPIDIHHQAQGIITLAKLYNLFKKDHYLYFTKLILRWTIDNMQDKTGFFYYQKWPFLTNKIPYMRWSQAWMILALSTVINEIKEEILNEKNC